MKKFVVVIFALLAAMQSMAHEVKIQTTSVGEAKISCKSEKWQVKAKATTKDGFEEITVEMTAQQPTAPAPLTVQFSTPQLDAHHLWSTDKMCHTELRPDWGTAYSSSLAQQMPIYSFI